MEYDRIGFGEIKVEQDQTAFKYGIDAVLLSHFAAETKAPLILELGSGNGIIAFILSHKSPSSQIIGVEKQKSQYEISRRNLLINKLSHKINFICMDILDFDILKFNKGERVGCVVSNPPYFARGSSILSKNESALISRHETTATINDFVELASKSLYKGGEFYLVHRPSRIVDIISACRDHSLEPKTIKFVRPYTNKAPNLFLLRCVKGAGVELTYEPDICVYDLDGNYSDEVLEMYKS